MAELNSPGSDGSGFDGSGLDLSGPDDLGPAPVEKARRRGPDPVALVAGVLTLAMATAAFVGQVPTHLDPRWLLAAGAALLGLLLLAGSLRGRRS